MASYPQFTKDYILYELPMIDGWILWSYSMFNDPVHKFSGIEMENGGYLGIESDILLNDLRAMKLKQSK